MSKHTPGPWTYRKLGVRAITYAITSGSTSIAATTDSKARKAEEQIPNARLIAAAPEMYEALVWILQYIESPDSFKAPAIEKVRAAIRKAEGTEDK